MPLHPPGRPKPTMFAQVHDKFASRSADESDDRVCARDTGIGMRLYTRPPLPPNGDEGAAVTWRRAAAGAQLVKQAMINQYGSDVAEPAFRNVSLMRHRDLEVE